MVVKFFSWFCIALLFLASPLDVRGSENAENSYTLRRCIEIALNNATSVRKAENVLKLQGADVLKNYGNFLPRFSTSVGYSPYTLSRAYALNPSGTAITSVKTKSKSIDLTVTTSLNLFNGFSDYASLQAALKKEDAVGYTLLRAQQAIAFDVTQTYYQVLLEQELLAIARENFLLAQDQQTLTDRQFQVGLKSIIDRDQQRADAAASGLSVIKAETRMQKSKFELMRRMQMDPVATATFTLEPLPESFTSPLSLKPDPDALALLAVQQRGDLKGKELETIASKWQVTQARSTWYPHLDLAFNVSSRGTKYLNQSSDEIAYPPLSSQLENSIGYSVGLNLSWAIFDGFQTRYTVESAKINQINLHYEYDDLKNDLLIDLYEAAGEYNSALMQIETAKISLNAASSAFNGIKRKYELGAASFIELSTARAAFFNARSNLSQATYNLALQKSTLDFATGNEAIPSQPEYPLPVK